MADKKKEEPEKLDENKVTQNDVSDDTASSSDDVIEDEKDYVTREINLDDLYDGSVNNTVVIDPVTNNEVLLSNKKHNHTILGVILAVLVLLLLYYVNNKSSIGKKNTDVEPVTTTTQAKIEGDYGTLSCTYKSTSDAENQTVTYTANYENSQITSTNFNFVAISNSDTTSAVFDDLKSQYETFFINNASVTGNLVSFETTSSGFTFNVETNYETAGFDGLQTEDGKTILYVKPSANDTIESLEEAYINKGFSCSRINNSEGE